MFGSFWFKNKKIQHDLSTPDLPFMFLVLFRSFVLCFVNVSLRYKLCVITSNKTKLRTKPMIRDDKLGYSFLEFIECHCVYVLDPMNGFLCFGIFTCFHLHSREHSIIYMLKEHLCELNNT